MGGNRNVFIFYYENEMGMGIRSWEWKEMGSENHSLTYLYTLYIHTYIHKYTQLGVIYNKYQKMTFT